MMAVGLAMILTGLVVGALLGHPEISAWNEADMMALAVIGIGWVLCFFAMSVWLLELWESL